MVTSDRPAGGAVRIGCAGMPPGMRRERFFEHVELLETDVVFGGRVKTAKLARWRDGLPARCGYALVASQRITHRPSAAAAKRMRPPLSAVERNDAGHFGRTQTVLAGLEDTLAAAEAIAAEAIVFRTPASFTPTRAHREAMRWFFRETVPAAARRRATLVWNPEGVWEDAEAHALATDLGLILARDPLAPEPPAMWGDSGYFYLAGLGLARRRFSDDQLEHLVDLIERLRRVWVVFANPDRYRDARRLTSLLRT